MKIYMCEKKTFPFSEHVKRLPLFENKVIFGIIKMPKNKNENDDDDDDDDEGDDVEIRANKQTN